MIENKNTPDSASIGSKNTASAGSLRKEVSGLPRQGRRARRKWWRRAGQEMARLQREAPRRESAVPGGLRLVVANLHFGRPPAGFPQRDYPSGKAGIDEFSKDATTILRDTVNTLSGLEPDIVLLQEVDKGQRRSAYLDQAQMLANGLQLPYWQMAASFAGQAFGWRRRPRTSAIPNTCGHGVMIASRWPVKSWHVKRLGKAWPYLKWRNKPWIGWRNGVLAGVSDLISSLAGIGIYWGQTRVVLVAQVVTPGGLIPVGCTHLEIQKTVAASQARRAWGSVFGLRPGRCLLGGDFNLSQSEVSQALGILDETHQPTLHESIPSFPTHNPSQTIDQVLGSGWKLAKPIRAVQLAVSDHRTLVFDLIPADAP